MRHAIIAALLIACVVAKAGEPGSQGAPERKGAEPLAKNGVIHDVVAGEPHANGAARWDSMVFGNLSSTCWLSGAARRRELGKHASATPRADHLDCQAISVWVYNKTDQPLLCEGRLRLSVPDDAGLKVIQRTQVVLPREMGRVATAFTYAANRPESQKTECRIASATDLLRLPPSDCHLKMLSTADPDTFYPQAAKEQGRTGVVTIDAAVDASSQSLRDVFVSESYAGRDFDIAALQVAMETRMAPEDCGGKRVRFRVKFTATESGD